METLLIPEETETLSPAFSLSVVDSAEDVAPADWDRLAGSQPFLRHAFFLALERHGCTGAAAGWQPLHLLLRRRGALAGILPVFLKSHSWGEYVFDQSWAQAYARRGRAWYPKLVASVPFTPVTGPRLLGDSPAAVDALATGFVVLARRLNVSSAHCLFPADSDLARLSGAGYLIRRSVQFHWHNRGYGSFEDFLAALTRDKRKKIRQDRRKVQTAGLTYAWRHGAELAAADWDFFYDCYAATYHAHGAEPYLNPGFFREIGSTLADAIVMVIASQGGTPVAAALNFRSGDTLYGRYWGALAHYAACHFETAYYQGIEYCIRHGIGRFEAGAQGEHKLARGFTPATTASAHWLADASFATAIRDFLARETQTLDGYVDELTERAPYRETAPLPAAD